MRLDETIMGVQIEKRSKDRGLKCYRFNDWEQEEKSSKKIESVLRGERDFPGGSVVGNLPASAGDMVRSLV